jgi:hypothetical protein
MGVAYESPCQGSRPADHVSSTRVHRAQRQATLQIITAAEAGGHARVAEMNKQVAANLGKIITALEADDASDGPRQEAPASAC